jgi:hypothetical protein
VEMLWFTCGMAVGAWGIIAIYGAASWLWKWYYKGE